MTSLSRYLFCALLGITANVCNAQIITTFAGNGGTGSPGSGWPATAVGFTYLQNAVPDNLGNVYITDNAAFLYRVNPSGILDQWAGTGGTGTAGDGGPATAAQISGGSFLAVDGLNNVYVSVDNKIRKITVATGVINSLAGAGTCTWGLSGDGGPALSGEMCGMSGFAVRGTTSPSIYFSQWAHHKVRKVAGGIMDMFAGYSPLSPGYFGDGGPALSAQLYYPGAMATDASGNVYICDAGNRVVRKVNTAGVISTYAGNVGLYGNLGDGGPATAAGFIDPQAIAIDGAGNLYIADYSANVVRKVNTAGIITTVVGTGVAGFSGDGGPAAFARVNHPSRLSADNAGNLYLIDDNNRVRKIWATSDAPPSFTGGYNQSIAMCSTATSLSVSSLLAITDANVGQNETWAVVSGPLHGSLTGLPASMTSTGGTLTPTGVTYTPTTGYVGIDTIKVSISDDTCVSFTTIYVSVDTAPVAGTLSGASTVCVGGTTTLSASDTGGTWSVSNTNATVAAGVVSGVAAGTTTVSYTVTNGCGSATATQLMTINPIASPGTITGPDTVCTFATIALANAVTGGTWGITTGNVAVSTSGVVTGMAAGPDTVRYTVMLGSCPSYTTKPITVLAPPPAPTIFGLPDVCVGSTITLAGSTPGVWSMSNANATITAGGVVTGVAVGADIVTLTVTNICGTAWGAATINVITAPTTAGTITGPSTVCVGATISLTRSVTGGSWSSSNTSVASVNALGRVYGLAEGTVTITYKITNACGFAITTYSVTVGCDTRVGETGTAAGLNVYPNPSTGNFVISKLMPGDNVRVYDVNGKLQFELSGVVTAQENVAVDLISLVPGCYFLSVSDKEGNAVLRTVLQKQ